MHDDARATCTINTCTMVHYDGSQEPEEPTSVLWLSSTLPQCAAVFSAEVQMGWGLG